MLGIPSIKLWKCVMKAPYEVCAIDYDCCGHLLCSKKLSPGANLELISALASASREQSGDLIDIE
jgi:hypothetical protein